MSPAGVDSSRFAQNRRNIFTRKLRLAAEVLSGLPGQRCGAMLSSCHDNTCIHLRVWSDATILPACRQNGTQWHQLRVICPYVVQWH